MHTSVLDLKTRILSSQERTTIQRADFNIVGDSVQFDPDTRTGRLIGNVKMVIADRSHLEEKPDTNELKNWRCAFCLSLVPRRRTRTDRSPQRQSLLLRAQRRRKKQLPKKKINRQRLNQLISLRLACNLTNQPQRKSTQMKRLLIQQRTWASLAAELR